MKIILPCLILMLQLGIQRSANAQNNNKPTQLIYAISSLTDVTCKAIISFGGNANNKRILLNWTLDKNQEIDVMEVERSSDRKNFVFSGLIFGTNQPGRIDYLFYEKNKPGFFNYRLKIIHKDKTVDYSAVISPRTALVSL